MTQPIPHIIQGDNIVLMIDNQSYTISKDSHVNYDRIVRALQKGKWKKVAKLVDLVTALTDYASGKLEITNGKLYWDGRHFHNAMSTRMMEMYEQGFSIDPLINFMENLMENPSYRAVDELYGFLEKNQLPITPDGYFLAYKKVRVSTDRNNFDDGDYVDIHSGTVRNNVGDTPSMPRNLVNDDADQTCSDGLHFASLEYMPSFGGNNPIVLLKINPADVVSIPSDYNNQKGRCCKYEVVGVHGKSDQQEAFDNVVEEFEPGQFGEITANGGRQRDNKGRFC